MVRLLLARLTWDWKSYEKFQQDDKFKALESQTCRMDICHYSFPQNLNYLLQGIGKLKPVKKFEGCGSYNKLIKSYTKTQVSILNDMLVSISKVESHCRHDSIKLWLIASSIKTLKEQTGLQYPIAKLIN